MQMWFLYNFPSIKKLNVLQEKKNHSEDQAKNHISINAI